MRNFTEFVVLEWLEDLPHYPRYCFATVKHAEELGPDVRWVQLYVSLDSAAGAARLLNVRSASSDGRGDYPLV